MPSIHSTWCISIRGKHNLQMWWCITCTVMQIVTAELLYECITCIFLIDKCWITEFFRCYIVNSVKQVHSIPPDLDYFLWGYLKNLVAHKSEAVASMREMLRILERVHQSLHLRCQTCITTDDPNFGELFKHYTCQRNFQ